MDNKNLPPLESDAELVATPNVFAEIIAGRAPVSEVYRDDLVMAFMDIQPTSYGATRSSCRCDLPAFSMS